MSYNEKGGFRMPNASYRTFEEVARNDAETARERMKKRNLEVFRNRVIVGVLIIAGINYLLGDPIGRFFSSN